MDGWSTLFVRRSVEKNHQLFVSSYWFLPWDRILRNNWQNDNKRTKLTLRFFRHALCIFAWKKNQKQKMPSFTLISLAGARNAALGWRQYAMSYWKSTRVNEPYLGCETRRVDELCDYPQSNFIQRELDFVLILETNSLQRMRIERGWRERPAGVWERVRRTLLECLPGRLVT